MWFVESTLFRGDVKGKLKGQPAFSRYPDMSV